MKDKPTIYLLFILIVAFVFGIIIDRCEFNNTDKVCESIYGENSEWDGSKCVVWINPTQSEEQ